MDKPNGRVWIGETGERVCVKVEGRATHLFGLPMRSFAEEMIRRRVGSFEVDLADCIYMDSTFLGVLVGISMQLTRQGLPQLVVRNASARSLELFIALGVERFFTLDAPSDAKGEAGPSLEPLDAGSAASKSEWARGIMDAHHTLIEADDDNQVRFKDLLEYLKDELTKDKDAPLAPPGH